MKKLLAFVLALGSIGFVASSANATSISSLSEASAATPQRDYRRGRRYNNRRYNRSRVTTQTRFVRQGRRTYRETYRVWYFPNGGTRTQLLSRTRVS